MKQPLVSIIVITYNHERYIFKCIKSVLAQTYKNWEMLIVDDGSTDRTYEIAKKFVDPRIRLLRRRNIGPAGLSKTYNAALKILKGEFLCLLDGDDWWDKDKLKTQISSFEDEDVVMSFGKSVCILNSGRTIGLLYPKVKKSIYENNPVGSALKAFLMMNNFVNQTYMIRRESLMKIGGFHQPKYMPIFDFPTWINLSLKGKFKYVPNCVCYWRRHENSINFKKNAVIIKGYKRYVDEFAAKNYEFLTKKLKLDVLKIQKINANILTKTLRLQNLKSGIFLLMFKNYSSALRYFLASLNEVPLSHIPISAVGILLSIMKIDVVHHLVFIVNKMRDYFT